MYTATAQFATSVTETKKISAIIPVALRSISVADKELQRTFFNTLSSQSRFMRFMGPMGDIPDYLLRNLSNVNADNHFAYMLTIGSGDERIMIGEARLVIDEDNRSKAEFALALLDEHRGNGLARKLMLLLETVADQNNIQQLTGYTLRSNKAMKKLARRFHYYLRNDARDARAVIMQKSFLPLAHCA